MVIPGSTEDHLNASEEEVDVELRQLVDGIEELQGPDTFYECVTGEEKLDNGGSQLNNLGISADNQGTSQVIIPDGRSFSVRGGTTTHYELLHQQTSAPPARSTFDSIHIPTSAAEEYQTSPAKKVPKFYRFPVKTTKNTSRRQLLQSYSQVMESIQFDALQEVTSGSRYEFDSASVIVKSANSSRGSTPSRGSFRATVENHQMEKRREKERVEES